MKIAEKNSSFRKALTIVWLITTLILLVIAVILVLSPGSDSMPGWAGGFLFLFYACAPIVGGGAYLVFNGFRKKRTRRLLKIREAFGFPTD